MMATEAATLCYSFVMNAMASMTAATAHLSNCVAEWGMWTASIATEGAAKVTSATHTGMAIYTSVAATVTHVGNVVVVVMAVWMAAKVPQHRC